MSLFGTVCATCKFIKANWRRWKVAFSSRFCTGIVSTIKLFLHDLNCTGLAGSFPLTNIKADCGDINHYATGSESALLPMGQSVISEISNKNI